MLPSRNCGTTRLSQGQKVLDANPLRASGPGRDGMPRSVKSIRKFVRINDGLCHPSKAEGAQTCRRSHVLVHSSLRYSSNAATDTSDSCLTIVCVNSLVP